MRIFDMLDATVALKLLPSIGGFIANGMNDYSNKCTALINILKNDNKLLIGYALKNVELAKQMIKENNNTKVGEFYAASRGYNLLEEFITYQRYTVTPSGVDKPSHNELWDNFKDWLEADNSNKVLEDTISKFIEENRKIRKIIFDARTDIRNAVNHQNNMSQYISALENAAIGVTNSTLEFYRYTHK